jgi:hypothetical protein
VQQGSAFGSRTLHVFVGIGGEFVQGIVSRTVGQLPKLFGHLGAELQQGQVALLPGIDQVVDIFVGRHLVAIPCSTIIALAGQAVIQRLLNGRWSRTVASSRTPSAVLTEPAASMGQAHTS